LEGRTARVRPRSGSRQDRLRSCEAASGSRSRPHLDNRTRARGPATHRAVAAVRAARARHLGRWCLGRVRFGHLVERACLLEARLLEEGSASVLLHSRFCGPTFTPEGDEVREQPQQLRRQAASSPRRRCIVSEQRQCQAGDCFGDWFPGLGAGQAKVSPRSGSGARSGGR
jgi:hypothetical protein